MTDKVHIFDIVPADIALAATESYFGKHFKRDKFNTAQTAYKFTTSNP